MCRRAIAREDLTRCRENAHVHRSSARATGTYLLACSNPGASQQEEVKRKGRDHPICDKRAKQLKSDQNLADSYRCSIQSRAIALEFFQMQSSSYEESLLCFQQCAAEEMFPQQYAFL